MRYEDKILELIVTSNEHLTAEQLFFKLKETYPGVVLATVYNNLGSLYKSGKIRKISLDGCPDRFDKNTKHDHLVCRRCGSVSDVYLADFTAAIEEQTGIAIDSYDLNISYLCPDCKNKEKNHQN